MMSGCEADTGNNADDVDAFGMRFFSTRQPQKAKPSVKRVNGVGSGTSDPYRYNMDYTSMGTCLIINNKNFKGLSCRDGTDADAAAAAETFTRLGYTIKMVTDQEASQMRELLYNVSQEDHSRCASFVCVMLSHGDEGKIYGTDEHVELKALTGMFRGDLCRSLLGKPKLFFIQACRGTDLDDGVETDSDETDSRSVQSEDCRLPVEADFLYAYSTAPGYLSWRNIYSGSWFMQALCTTLNDHGAVLPLMQMLTRVNGKVALDFESNSTQPGYNRKKQIPSIVSMLTKELYFPTVTAPVVWPTVVFPQVL